MKKTIIKFALGVTVAALTGLSAEAGGGLEGMRGTYVPVPAPVPIPEYKAQWYLRADIGLALNGSTGMNHSGSFYGIDDGGRQAQQPFGLGGSPYGIFSQDSGDDLRTSFGIGAGYYFSPNFRMDFTAEIRQRKRHVREGEFSYSDWNPISIPPGFTGEIVNGDVHDETRLHSGIFMANAYIDFSRFGSWKPYLGAGLGFSLNEISRRHRTNLSFCDMLSDPSCSSMTGLVYSEQQREYTATLAASLTAGASYRVSDITSLDFNYRYLYVGGTSAGLGINGFSTNVSIADQHEHYLRAGLRWDIN